MGWHVQPTVIDPYQELCVIKVLSPQNLDDGNPKSLRIGKWLEFSSTFSPFPFSIHWKNWLALEFQVSRKHKSFQDEIFQRWYSSILGITNHLNFEKHGWLEKTLIMMKFCMKTWSVSSHLGFQRFLGFLAGKYQEGLWLSPKVARYQVLQWFMFHEKVFFFAGVPLCYCFFATNNTTHFCWKTDICLGIFCLSLHQAGPTFHVGKVGCFRHGCRILSFHWQPKVLLSWSLERLIRGSKLWDPVVIHPWRIIPVRLVRSSCS